MTTSPRSEPAHAFPQRVPNRAVNQPAPIASRHGLGVLCGISAGVWLGAAEAPTKLVNAGLSPYAISLCMVLGVFIARWSVPTLLKGTRSVFADIARNRHLIPFAILAGMLWAVANTLTVFAIRDVGLVIAFPLWNTNSLVGILWGRLLFGELKGASRANILRVLLGAGAIVAAAILLGFSTLHIGATPAPHRAAGILAACGASVLWGSMYIPYRKAYLSGLNPLSFVTVFTVGELATMLALVFVFDRASIPLLLHAPQARGVLFWLFLGGFVWVVGDIFQQFATKYLGIGRGIPLSNTNQLWGFAWGALVFGELAHADALHRTLVIAGSVIMVLGALAVSTAIATSREDASTHAAMERESERYSLDHAEVLRGFHGDAPHTSRRDWWDYLILAGSAAVFVVLAFQARMPAIPVQRAWAAALSALLLVTAAMCAVRLRRPARAS